MAVLKEAAGEVLGITAAIEKAVSLKVPSLTIYFQYEGPPLSVFCNLLAFPADDCSLRQITHLPAGNTLVITGMWSL